MATKTAADVAKKIKAVNKAIGAAVAKGDGAAVAKMYAKGARLLPPGTEPLKGKGIKEFWQNAVSPTGMGVTAAAIKSKEVAVQGSTAIEVGNYTLTTPAGQSKGNYIVVWKKEGKDWKLFRDIFN
jgi:ketosteroid isomerase-like protein